MPTFARLVAAVLLAALGWVVATLAIPYFDEGTPLGMIQIVSAGWGLVTGWIFTAPKLARGIGSAFAIGLSSAVVQAFLTILSFSVRQMVDRAFRMSYGTVMDAVAGVFESGLDYAIIVGKPDVIAVAAIGGIVTGYVTRYVARHYR
ncbi:TrgA family protein [Maritimibacter sp. DP1N21-5]|uniref:TrgA family protein n=1 Tax=Maritimibacter sp. DP1N21-5 TaxID=2836867 RepID=UPI001C450A8D|nr:TrgA family protein [Maritimibacter sp. DP1N21-5]MBV7409677.1 TrgA family protein [Maritimibacter sp. DP1N21-5]